MATHPAKLTLQQVLNFLQEEWRRHESAKLQWDKERAIVLGNAERLQEVASQHEGIVSMLEKRISMLEAALQQERSSIMQTAAIARPDTQQQIIEAPASHAIQDLPAFDSPGSSKENTEPEQPFSTRKRFSPGFSPLGRRQRKRGDQDQGTGTPMGEQSASSRRRHAQRSLAFGGPPASEAAPLSKDVGKGGHAPADAGRITQRIPQPPNNAARSPASLPHGGVEPSVPGLLDTPHQHWPPAAQIQVSTQAEFQSHSPCQPPSEQAQTQGAVLVAPVQNEVSGQDPDEDFAKALPPASATAAAVLLYDFPEDGQLVALSIHDHDPQYSGHEPLLNRRCHGEPRPVLAELEGVIFTSPPRPIKNPSKVTRKGVDLLAEDTSQMGLNDNPSSSASSRNGSPARSPLRV